MDLHKSGKRKKKRKHQTYELAIALPHPKVLNFASTIFPSSTLIWSFITSPQAGAPTSPVPTLSSSLSREPAFRGLESGMCAGEMMMTMSKQRQDHSREKKKEKKMTHSDPGHAHGTVAVAAAGGVERRPRKHGCWRRDRRRWKVSGGGDLVEKANGSSSAFLLLIVRWFGRLRGRGEVRMKRCEEVM